MGDEPHFRASKRRRVFRKRPDEDEEPSAPGAHAAEAQSTVPTIDPVSTRENEDGDGEGRGLSAAEIIRRRRLANNRKGGVGFSISESQRNSIARDEDSAMAIMKPEQTAVEMVQNRFTAPTGIVINEDDKHM